MNRYLYVLALFLLSLFLGLEACQNPLEGVTIGLKDPIQSGVIECRLYDPAGNPLPANSRIIISGPDANAVVTTLNSKKYKITTDGVLLLAVSPEVMPSAQRPFRFTVAIVTPDYLTVVQPFVLTNGNRQVRSLPLISLSKPPVGMTPADQSGQPANTGTILSLHTSPTAQGDMARVQIPSGTSFTDREGKPVSGKLTLQLIHTNARTGNAAGQLPGGPVFSNVVGVGAGTSLRAQSVAGSISIKVFNEDFQLVQQLSQPGELNMDLNPGTVNPRAGRTIQPGDSIPLFSYDAVTGVWKPEKAGIVVREASTGRLTLQARFTQAVSYIAAWTTPVCSLGPVFSVRSKLTGVDVKYKCQLIDAQTKAVVTTFFAGVNNNDRIAIANQEAGRSFILRVFDETDAWGKGAKGGLIGESAPATSCDQTPIALLLNELPVPPSMQLQFQFSCPQGKLLDEASLPALMLTQYSEVGKDNWRDLVSATRTQRNVTSYKLRVGQRYDFRASTDGGASWPLRQNDYLVDKATWALKIKAEMYCK